MVKKAVTLSIDKNIYEKFQKICDRDGMNYSKKVQTLIEKFIKS